MKAMLVFDLDGTLLCGGSLSKKTEEYLAFLKERGYLLVVATGRSFPSLQEVINPTFFHYIITYAGACIYDVKSSKYLYKNTISKNDLMHLWEYRDNHFKKITLFSSTQTINCEDPFENFDEFVDSMEDITHVSIVMDENISVEKFYQKFKDSFKGLYIMIMQDSFGAKKWIEVGGLNCKKYFAISKLAFLLSIPNEKIIAFGDSFNDVDMIQNCGIGVAMKNALCEVKKVSDYITFQTNEEDGVIDFLEKFLKEKK